HQDDQEVRLPAGAPLERGELRGGSRRLLGVTEHLLAVRSDFYRGRRDGIMGHGAQSTLAVSHEAGGASSRRGGAIAPRGGYPQISPYLYYADADAALDWLVKAFGFRVRSAFRDPGGHVVHAQLEHGSGVIFVGPGVAQFGTHSVADRNAVHAALFVYVDDLDAHLARARAAGTAIRAEPARIPNGDRTYVAADPEGQRWIFAEAG